MSALTLPLDNRESNNYIAALERQFKGKFRSARDMSVYFTTRPDSETTFANIKPLHQEYKILDNTFFPRPDLALPLDTQLSLAQYQIWVDETDTFTVEGTGVLQSSPYWFIPSGTEVTVSQNGSGSVPSAETFVAVTDPIVFWALVEEGVIIYLYPHTGKAWYGAVTAPAENGVVADKIILVLLMADGTFHTQLLGEQINENFVFFTHLYDTYSNQAEIYFTGKELDYVPEGYPTEAYVAPTFIYVPD